MRRASIVPHLIGPRKVQERQCRLPLPNASDRANVIAYLETLGRAAAAAGQRAGGKRAGRCYTICAGPTQAELLGAAQDKSNWLYASKDYTGQRFVDLKPDNAKECRAVARRGASIARTMRAHADESPGLQGRDVSDDRQGDSRDRRHDLPRARRSTGQERVPFCHLPIAAWR